MTKCLSVWEKLVLAVVVLLIVFLVLPRIWQSWRASRFDSQIWKADTFEAFSKKEWKQLLEVRRDLMVEDLLKRYHLLGMSRSEVVGLLGEPDRYRKEPFQDWDMIYWLGPDDRGPAGFIDLKWLLIKLDATNHVVACKIAVD